MLKDILKNNIYIHDKAALTKHKRENSIMKERVAKCSDIDSIQDFETFQELVKLWKKEKNFSSALNVYKCVGSESLLYGHLHALCDYCGMEYHNSNLLFPKIKHGMYFWEKPSQWIFESADFNYIFQGTDKIGIIHDINPYIPAYSVGPYVHYARDYYTDVEFRNLKKQIGKTLLVFPFHSYETRKLSCDSKKLVDDIYLRYASEFDTIMVSIYWNDVDNEICKLFKEKGAMLVSNGFRGDDNFIRRLKAIIQLSDVTLGNDLGSHIGYSIYLGKPHIFLGNHKCTVDKEDEFMRLSNQDEIEKADNFNRCIEEFSYENYKLGLLGMESVFYKKFWGGKECVKSPEELKAIFEVSNKILEYSFGFRSKVDDSVKRTLTYYMKKNDIIHYNVLRRALGDNIDSAFPIILE